MKESELSHGAIVKWIDDPTEREWTCLHVSKIHEDCIQTLETDEERKAQGCTEYALFSGAWYLEETGGDRLNSRSYGKCTGEIMRSELPELKLID